jgi:NAD+ kinase
MKIAIYGRLLHTDNTPYIQQLFDILEEHEIQITIFENFYAHLVKRIDFKQEVQTFKSHEEIREEVDYLLSLGGDGTLLDSVTLVRDANIPIAGINIGRLGFLASIGKNEMDAAITDIINGTFTIDERHLLELESNKELFGDLNWALNDFTIHKQETSAMVIIHTYVNGDFLNSYWADGLVVATPTGSTAYSLSCGGPIIFPDAQTFAITPVAPHNLNVRPIVVPNDSLISFEVEGRSENFMCTLDSRTETIDTTFKLAISIADFTIKLIRLSDEKFMDTLRNKLMWGKDTRN